MQDAVISRLMLLKRSSSGMHLVSDMAADSVQGQEPGEGNRSYARLAAVAERA
eukprot:CAMPEP_0195069256 /NCGR_PEP_ID=MMETSP0448-20130528/13595_1 /TAXON_ID=66468 /ORGANISM="Heterocapsa triquestra, Strain CCMP 448" /LENGTH=52 /DNA_ID=CAMNT_0040100821 /DNA_START=274 /DNA_END=428 /DNA_ORIENTATION=+